MTFNINIDGTTYTVHLKRQGLLQFSNATYGIEPLESAHGFQHLIYQTNYGNSNLPISTENYHIKWSTELTQRVNIEVPANFTTQRYLEIQVVVAKTLMFFKLNTKVILTSVEFWKKKDKIETTRSMNELLQRFTEWKHSHLSLRPHDVAFLFIYREQSASVGSAFARKLCVKPTSAAVAVYKKEYTLENFSVIVAQLLGISLGIYFDQSRNCYCPGSACLMHTRAVQASGVKAFSSCSVKDFQSFLAHGQGQCLLNRPHLDLQYKTPSCGNGIVEDGEQCDCGTNRIKEKGTLCRTAPDQECDLAEYCNGTSTECTENFYVQNGQMCEERTGVCMNAVCQSPDRWCRKVFGRGSKSASSQCYEEINSQSDRMGHCGSSEKGYQNCQWQDLRCGKLVCDYPHNKPFLIENAAVIYARVHNRWCITLDYQKGKTMKDPFLVQNGAGCGQNKVCMNQRCVEYATIKPSCDAETKCNSKGVCNNKGNCHCQKGWAPPDCKTRETGGLGGSIDSTFRSAASPVRPRAVSVTTRNWLLVSFFLFLPVVIGSIVLAVKMREFLMWRSDEEPRDKEEEEEEKEEEVYQERQQQCTSLLAAAAAVATAVGGGREAERGCGSSRPAATAEAAAQLSPSHAFSFLIALQKIVRHKRDKPRTL
uniref:disintegrin and metalloproteinase domain-containing protein 2-like n=1 Tax=Euleptes europaea TaxID=460621 RepID=UPI0025401655|nr:disintegrin and metalloproteinase domain-containing protein 2-like [Euleptes europaea]